MDFLTSQDFLLFVLVVVGAVVGLGLFLAARHFAKNEDAERLMRELNWAMDMAELIIRRVGNGVTPEERLLYQEEADTANRDVRLVITYRELMQIAKTKGIYLPLDMAVNVAQGVYELLNRPDFTSKPVDEDTSLGDGILDADKLLHP